MVRGYKRFTWVLILQLCLIIETLRAPPSLSKLEVLTSEHTYSFQVEIVDTAKNLEKGLMNRKELAENEGMLFDFGKPQMIAMWMKNTLIGLDMLFIDSKNQIIFIQENATPHSLDLIMAPQPVKAVLEVKGGTVKKLGIKDGDLIKLN